MNTILRRLKEHSNSENRHQVVVIGNGMVGHKFCDLLSKHHKFKNFEVSVFGEECRPAYDRIHLTDYFKDREAGKLLLASEEWYAERGIGLHLADPIVEVDTEVKCVVSKTNKIASYDSLVFATGSRPFVPRIPGNDLPGVFTYRTIEDVQAILGYARNCRSAAVMGGGLLGLEAARALYEIGLETHIIELGDRLMPRQLDETGASLLMRQVERLGIKSHLSMGTREISAKDKSLTLHLYDSSQLTVDMIVISAGIRPRIELADASGIECPNGLGIGVDAKMRTSASNVYAIGECAYYRGKTYGFVTPGFEMAKVVVGQLTKGRISFKDSAYPVKLKLMGVDVMTMGESEVDRADVTLCHETESGYRRLVLNRNRIKSAMVVGAWSELPVLQTHVKENKRLPAGHIRRFVQKGSLWNLNCSPDIRSWPPSATVCNCLNVTLQTLSQARHSTSDVATLSEKTGAGTVCGSCKPLLAAFAGEEVVVVEPVPGYEGLAILSIFAALLGVVIAYLPPFPFSESVQNAWHIIDSLWREDLLKQISGYSLFGISLLALSLSLRKRSKHINVGHFGIWRVIHAALGVASLGMLIMHTGLRFGQNLNLALMTVFVLLNVLGAIAGGATSLESSAIGKTAMTVKKYRSVLTTAHVLLFLPLPLLVLLHIVSVYYF